MTSEEEIAALQVALDNANDTIERLEARVRELDQIGSELNILFCTLKNSGKEHEPKEN